MSPNTSKVKKDRNKKQKECMSRLREKIKNDPVKHDEYKRKERERYLKRKQQGKIKMVKDMSEREKRGQQKKWRERSKTAYQKKKQEKVLELQLRENSPPPSPLPNDIPMRNVNVDGRVAEGQKRRRAKLKLLNRQIEKLEEKLKNAQRGKDKYRKKYERLKDVQNISSPGKCVKKSLSGCVVSPKVKKQLLFAEVLRRELRTSYTSLKKREKIKFYNNIRKSTIKKYKLLGELKRTLGTSAALNPSKKKYDQVLMNKKKLVEDFYLNDESSRQTAGKNECITKKKIKMQKRFLNDSLFNLYQKFKNSNIEAKISFTAFTLWRPFWVLKRQVGKRDTCLCILHTNFFLTTWKLGTVLGVITQKTPQDVVATLCCELRELKCYERRCANCMYNDIVPVGSFDAAEEVIVERWIVRKETITVKGIKKKVRKTVKEKIAVKKGDLFAYFKELIPTYLIHIRNLHHQRSTVQNVQNSLTTEDCLIHVDFSENYNCKYGAEVQSAHFGGSKPQISLHTVVAYFALPSGDIQHISFCTMSPCLRHDPAAICAHLQPVLAELQRRVPNIKRIHFQSDGPLNQYRNRKMFSLIANFLVAQVKSVHKVRWHFTEKGHGKGAPDGIGGAIKRLADDVVSSGRDISDFSGMITELLKKNSKVLISAITEDDMIAIDPFIPEQLPKLPGVLKIHEITWARGTNIVQARELSCLECSEEQRCQHYHIGTMRIKKNKLRVEDVYSTSDEEDGPTNKTSFNVGDYVLVQYNESLYPGIILEIMADAAKVKCMQGQSTHTWKWPKSEDICTYPICDLIKKIPEPKLICKRGFYKVHGLD